MEILEFVRHNVSRLSPNLDKSLVQYAEDNNVEAVEILANLGADISFRHKNFTSLHWAAYWDSPEMVKFLLDHGSDIEEVTRDNEGTALHVAAEEANSNAMKVLLQRGANVNARDKEGSTPLHEAANKGYMKGAQLLIAYGADVKAVRDGQTPAECAKKNGHPLVSNWLMQIESGAVHVPDETERKYKIRQFLKKLLEPDVSTIAMYTS